jgi:hypothetical protein
MDKSKYGYQTIVAEKEAVTRMKDYASRHGIKLFRAVAMAINFYIDHAEASPSPIGVEEISTVDLGKFEQSVGEI